MRYAPSRHHRRSIRLAEHDYAGPAWYFVTICTAKRECALGKIERLEMELSRAGQIALDTWIELPERFLMVDLDACVVMPNTSTASSSSDPSATRIPTRRTP